VLRLVDLREAHMRLGAKEAVNVDIPDPEARSRNTNAARRSPRRAAFLPRNTMPPPDVNGEVHPPFYPTESAGTPTFSSPPASPLR
jgi:hypothetical protein